MAPGLALVALVPTGPLLYPVAGTLALGVGLAIPALTALISRRVSGREQGRLMGGIQAILSLTLISGPAICGLAFDRIGPEAPYWIGALLASLALLAAAADLLTRRGVIALRSDLVKERIVESEASGKQRERGA